MIKKIISQNKLNFSFLIIFIIINALLLLYIPELMNKIITYGLNSEIKKLYHYGFIMLITILSTTIISIIIILLSAISSVHIASYLRETIYQKVTTFTDLELSKFSISSLITRSTNDITNIQNTFNIGFKNLFAALTISCLGILKLSQITNDFLLITIFLSIFIIIIFLLILFIYTTPKFITLQNTTDKLNQELREELNGLMTIKAYNNESFTKQKYKKINYQYSKIDYQINKIMNFLNPYTTLILNFMIIIITYTTLKNLTNPQQIADLMTLTQYSIQIISSFLTLALLFILIPKAKVSYQRIQEILTINIPDKPINKLPSLQTITFQNINFSYNNQIILKDINFTINQGDKVAIIGPIGSGKSTLLKLLTKSLIPTSGTILFNTIDYAKLSFNDLTHIYSYTPQKPYFFSGTILSNLQIACPNIRKSQITQVLQSANLTELSQSHKVNANATNLSGGQKQRLAIAMALATKKDVIIIDDIKSGLDNSTIQKIFTELFTTYKHKTIITTATTTKYLENFNKIIVLDNGQITNIGTHDYLLKNDSIYQNLNEGVSNEES